MIYWNRSWFSLIELIIVMTIFIIISLISFAPYAFYMNKAKIQHTDKELSQIIYEAKNMAVNWSTTSSWNTSIWISINSTTWNNSSYELWSYKHDVLESDILSFNWNLIQRYILQPWVEFDNFDWEDKWIIFFRSISWTGIVFKWNWSYNKVAFTQWENEIEIGYSYKWAEEDALSNTLSYFQDTQIVDY